MLFEVLCGMKSFFFILLAELLILAIAPTLAQAPAERPRPPDGGTREVLVSILIPSIPNAPFSATVATESVRHLADGSRITLVNRRAIARDSSGRIFQERRLLVPDDGKHESILTQIEISNPVSHELFICVPKEKVCQVEFFSAPKFVPPAQTTASGSLNNQTGTPSRENLATQFLGGLETFGTRERTIIEAGLIGNDTPIQTTREYWYSPKLGVNLSSKLQDPRIGTQEFEVSDIVMGEPDAKLFKLPPNSRLIDLRVPAQSSPPSEPSN
jgi:hypothetical protein